MNYSFSRITRFTAIAILCVCIVSTMTAYPAAAITLPDPADDMPLAAEFAPEQSIVLGGGCFWGMEAVFQHIKGVKSAISGYSGGFADTAHYHMVSKGDTGHAEVVKVTFDPTQITLGTILKVYFSVAHNPTQLNAQGPDHGTQYRSAIFTSKPAQQKLARSYISQLNKTEMFEDKHIVTTVNPLVAFYPAEDYHQNFAKTHPYHPYIMAQDEPKIKALKKEFPNLFLNGE